MSKKEKKRKTCLNCGKSLKRINWYYRNGGYFCNKKCFKLYVAKQSQESS